MPTLKYDDIQTQLLLNSTNPMVSMIGISIRATNIPTDSQV